MSVLQHESFQHESFQHESLAVIISVTRAKIDDDAADGERKQQPQEFLLAPVLASHARIGCCITLVVRMLDRDKVTLLRTQYAPRSARNPCVKAHILIRTSLPRFSSLYNSNII